jgi:hypothetical protein
MLREEIQAIIETHPSATDATRAIINRVQKIQDANASVPDIDGATAQAIEDTLSLDESTESKALHVCFVLDDALDLCLTKCFNDDEYMCMGLLLRLSRDPQERWQPPQRNRQIEGITT